MQHNQNTEPNVTLSQCEHYRLCVKTDLNQDIQILTQQYNEQSDKIDAIGDELTRTSVKLDMMIKLLAGILGVLTTVGTGWFVWFITSPQIKETAFNLLRFLVFV